MMDLESAIRHCEEVARQNEEDAIVYSNCKKYKTNLYEIGLAENAEKKCCKCAEEHRQLAEWLKELKAYKVGESRSEIPNTCGDAISRQAAISAIEALQLPIMREASTCYQFKFSGMSEAKEAVENLPSVTPRQRTGRWIKKEEEGDAEPFIIWECSECHEYQRKQTTFCPNCGCAMKGELE